MNIRAVDKTDAEDRARFKVELKGRMEEFYNRCHQGEGANGGRFTETGGAGDICTDDGKPALDTHNFVKPDGKFDKKAYDKAKKEVAKWDKKDKKEAPKRAKAAADAEKKRIKADADASKKLAEGKKKADDRAAKEAADAAAADAKKVSDFDNAVSAAGDSNCDSYRALLDLRKKNPDLADRAKDAFDKASKACDAENKTSSDAADVENAKNEEEAKKPGRANYYNWKQIKNGMTQDQVGALLGAPHEPMKWSYVKPYDTVGYYLKEDQDTPYDGPRHPRTIRFENSKVVYVQSI